MSEKFESIEHFSQVIYEISTKIPEDGIILEDFIDIIGERGLFMSCMILTSPFLLPVSIPGSSIPFGSAIFLISIRIAFNTPILIPKRLMKMHISKHDLDLILKEILNILTPLEKIIKPRLCILVNNSKIKRFNGFMISFGAILLITPIIAPLGDFFPSYGILFTTLGYLEHDGYLILAGYITIVSTSIYYILIFAIGIKIILIILSYFGLHP